MTGTLQLCDGTTEALPRLLGWKFTHTDGTAADSFSVTFLYSPEWEGTLKKAVQFQAEEDGNIRFFGIIDEYEVTIGKDGTLAAIHGRGMGGLLMDNQVGQREYYWVRLSDILRNYVTPYGISVQYEKDHFLYSYAVEYGASAWKALEGFCLWAGGFYPRFLPDGTLLLSEGTGNQLELRETEKILEARWTSCRYGVYSSVTGKYAGTLLETTVRNREFEALGGWAVRRITIPRKNSCRAGGMSPEMELRRSREKARMLTLTLREPFFAQPGDIVTLKLDKLGLQGDFSVAETVNSQTETGTLCVLTMAEIGG